MFQDLSIDLDKYISSKRASEITGYTQDYIGQLARGSHIEAKRVGGLWYVSLDSLSVYRNKVEDFKPNQPVIGDQSFVGVDALINLDGREYISASRASEITGYNQDYVGQLARSGKIMARQVGNRWYIDKKALLIHKGEKDALLAVVQSQSVGISTKNNHDILIDQYRKEHPFLTYTMENGDLLPIIGQKETTFIARSDVKDSHIVPIRISHRPYPVSAGSVNISSKVNKYSQKEHLILNKDTMYRGVFPVIALTVVIMLSFGLISLKNSSKYTLDKDFQLQDVNVVRNLDASFLTASAILGFERIISFFDDLLAIKIEYHRE